MAVNDDIRNALESYGGFSINTRVYNYLGSLGYTGTISDRLAKYSYEDKKGWQALIARFSGGLSEFLQLQQSLFGNGEQGLLFVPEPGFRGEDVLYQDSAGTTLADANGDPAGLGLEFSQGLELGPELVTNGGFDADLSGWSNEGSHWQWNSGAAEMPLTSDYYPLHQSLAAAYQKRVKVTFDVTEVSGVLRACFSSSSLSGLYAVKTITQPGSYQINAVVEGEFDILNFSRNSGSTTSATIDNVSIREIPGNHLTQPTSADRPLYQTDGSLHWLAHDQAGDNLIASLPDLGTNATLAYANASGVTILEGQTINGDTIIPQEVELYGVIYLDRPFTASETTQVTDYLNKRRGA